MVIEDVMKGIGVAQLEEREQWLEARRSGVGGSDIAAIIGASPWGGPFSVYAEKVAGEQSEETDAMRRGRFLEPAVLNWAADICRWDECRHLDNAIVQKKQPGGWSAIASLDGLAVYRGDPIVIEVKTVHWSQAHKWGQVGDAVPVHVAAQVQWYLGITGLERGVVAALIGADDLRIYNITADTAVYKAMLERADAFWRNHVATRTPPPPDGSSAGSRFIDKMFEPPVDGLHIEPTETIAKLLAEYAKLKGEQDAISERAEIVRQALKLELGEATSTSTEWASVTYRPVRPPRRLDKKMLREELTNAGVDESVIDAAFEAATQQTGEPSRRLVIKLK